MSRHRNVRKLDFSEEYGYDDVYGRSLDDEVAISPNTAAEFLYQRDSREQPSLDSYLETRGDSSRQEECAKATKLKSPLATTSCIAKSRHPLPPPDIGPPPGFPPIFKPEVPHLPKAQVPLPGLHRHYHASTQPQDVLQSRPVPHYQPGTPSKGSTKKISSTATPKLGFNLSTLGEEEGRLSGTPSPSLSPFHSPARTPSPPAADQATKLSTPKVGSAVKSRYQKIDVLSEFKQREERSKEKINLVVVGHVDAGKSTLMGHLLYLLGNVSKKMMHKYEQESQKAGKSSFAYAWVLDETGEERHRGITMDIAQREFETESKVINLLDAPGHRDFIPNMITGAAQADVAVLVVNATVGEFEAGFEAGGQTREHAMLVRSLGVKQLAVAVNKLDTVGWSESRFNEVVQKLGTFLKQAGYKESDVKYVPCSGLAGENLTAPSTVEEFRQWYSGPTLIEIIDKFSSPMRPVERPFRCCIGDIFKGQSGGLSVAGRVDSGHVQVGENVQLLPAQEVVSIKTILTHEEATSWAAAGDQAIFNISGVDINKISIGSVLCSMQHPVRVVSRFEARIIVFNIEVPITTGYPVVLHYQSLSEPAVIKKLISLLNKASGEQLKKRPRCLTKNSTGVVRIEVTHPVCLELYQECKEFGRFMLRSSGHTIAAGVVTKILL